MNRNLLILGTEHYSTMAKEIAESMGCFAQINILSLNDVGDVAHLLKGDSDSLNDRIAFVATGSSAHRLELMRQLEEAHYAIALLVHPSAIVSPSAQIGKGTMVEATAVIASNVTISSGCILLAGSIAHHGCVIGAGCCIACNEVVPAGAVMESQCDWCEDTLRRCPENYSFEVGM